MDILFKMKEIIIRLIFANQLFVLTLASIVFLLGLFVIPLSLQKSFVPNFPLKISPNYFSSFKEDKSSSSLARFYSYTLEGRDEKGQPAIGWDLDALRSVQDEIVKPALESVEGVEKVISNGGFVVGDDQPRQVVFNKSGAEVVGGIVRIESNANPIVINRKLKSKIEEIAETLPQLKLGETRVSKLTIVPFYDQGEALERVIKTYQRFFFFLLILLFAFSFIYLINLRAALLVVIQQVLSLCLTFIGIKVFNLQFEMISFCFLLVPIILSWRSLLTVSQKIIKMTEGKFAEEGLLSEIKNSFQMEGLSFVKRLLIVGCLGFILILFTGSITLFANGLFILVLSSIACLVISITILPVLIRTLFRKKIVSSQPLFNFNTAVFILGGVLLVMNQLSGLILIALAVYGFALPLTEKEMIPNCRNKILELRTLIGNKIFEYQIVFVTLLLLLTFVLFSIGFGFSKLIAWTPESFRSSPFGRDMALAFPGLSEVGSLNEEQNLFPVTAILNEETRINAASATLKQLNLEIQSLEAIELIIGKVKPANNGSEVSQVFQMDSLIRFKPEYSLNEKGMPKLYLYDFNLKSFIVDQFGNPIEHASGKPYRNWGKAITGPDDIWSEVKDVFSERNIVPSLISDSKVNLHQLLISVFVMVGLLIFLFDFYLSILFRKFFKPET